MVWVQVFPTGATFINQSVPQFNDNWLFLQNNINTDHFFNTGGATEGHHKFMQLFDTGNPAIAGGAAGVLYATATPGGVEQTWFHNTTLNQINQIPVGFFDQQNNVGAQVFFNMGPQPQFAGFFIIYQIGGTANQGSGMVVWDGINARVTQTSVRGQVTLIGDNGGTLIAVNQTVPGVSLWAIKLFMMVI